LTTYAEQLGLSPDGSEIPEDDYIFLVRNELGDYGDLFRFDNSGRMIASYEFRISLGLDVEIDYATMKEVGFLNNILDLDFLHNQSNVIGAFKFYNTEDLYYPIEYDIICSEPIVTEFFLFVKSDNFSGITYAAATIENISGRNYIQEIYSSDIAYNSKPLISKVDGELSNSLTVGEGGTVHNVTYLDTDESVLWESLVPTGIKASRIFLNFETKTSPGFKHIFSGWAESMGFLGVLGYFCILGFFAWRGYSLMIESKNKFSALLAFGLTSIIVVQSLLNCGVVCGALPVTGITLPFFSSGGSSLLATCCICGLLLGISYRNRVEDIDEV